MRLNHSTAPKGKSERRGKLSTLAKKVSSCALAAVLATAMCVPAAAFAIDGKPTAGNPYGMNASNEIGTNTVPKTANGDTLFDLETLHDSRIVAACGGSGTAIQDYMDVLGADGIGTSGYNWGTKINVAPNAFAWNDLLYTDESSVTCTQISMGGDASDSSLGIGFVKSGPNGVCTYATVSKFRPQILANNESSTYEKIVDAIQAADGNKNYNPQYVTLDTTGLCTLVDSMWNGAAAMKKVEGYGTTVNGRYGDPEAIAQDFENFIKATQWYILSKHEQDNTMKTVAYVTGYADGAITVAAPDPTEQTTSAGRQYEGFEQISHNVAFAYDAKGVLQRGDDGAAALASGFEETTTTSPGPGGQQQTTKTIGTSNIANLTKCDAIFTSLSGDNLTNFTNAVKAAGYQGEVVSPSLAVGNQGFGFARNLMEYAGYLYPDDFKLSYGLYYFWNKFGHVSADYVDAIMVDQDSNKLLPTGDADTDLDTAGYSEDYMKKIFAAGQNYYKANSENANSYCSNYRLRAQGTATKEADQANNKYVFDLLDYGKSAEPTVTPTAVPTLANNTMSVNAKAVTVKYSKLKKGKVTVSISKAITVKNAKGTVTYKKTKGSNKITVNAKTGKITIKKGAIKKGKKATIKVKVTAAGDKSYKSLSKTVSVKITAK